MTQEYQVQLFLDQARRLACTRFLVRNRAKNRDAFALLGIGRRDVVDAVLGLDVADFVSGPLPNLDRPGEEVWVFGAKCWGAEVYLKLALAVEREACICISCHPSERPLIYPFSKREETP